MKKRNRILPALLAGLSVLATGCSSKPKQAHGASPDLRFESSGNASNHDRAGRDRALKEMRDVLRTVYFPLDGFALDEDAKAALVKIAGFMNEYRDITLSVNGYCDERGTEDYNLALGERRARTVMEFLHAYGVDESRIRILSYGEERPASQGHDEQSYRMNRRAEFGAPM
jgi:peptidoglycan-associated lipoprotein